MNILFKAYTERSPRLLFQPLLSLFSIIECFFTPIVVVLKHTSFLCPCQVLFDGGQWDRLIDEFKRENYKLNCMTPDSLLSIHLRAGLSALKTP